MKKVAIMILDSTIEEMNELFVSLREVGERTGYEFILSSKSIECISKDDLIRVVDDLKTEEVKCNE